MHTDFKIQTLIEKEGLEGYGIWLLCLEFLGKEGEKRSKEGKRWSLHGQTRWFYLLLSLARWSDEGKLKKILETMAEIGLICAKSLKYGHLYCPNFSKRADDYTTRQLRTNSEPNTNNVPLDKNRIDKIRTEYSRLAGYDESSYLPGDYARYHAAIKKLVVRAGGKDELVIEALNWISKQNFSWTLETLNKKWFDFVKSRNGASFVNSGGSGWKRP
jgi:hypothetical protein